MATKLAERSWQQKSLQLGVDWLTVGYMRHPGASCLTKRKSNQQLWRQNSWINLCEGKSASFCALWNGRNRFASKCDFSLLSDTALGWTLLLEIFCYILPVIFARNPFLAYEHRTFTFSFLDFGKENVITFQQFVRLFVHKDYCQNVVRSCTPLSL